MAATPPGREPRSGSGCREQDVPTFADLDAITVHEVVLNGEPIDPAAVIAGRVPLAGLAADNTLVVEATVPVSRSGSGLTQYTGPADGRSYVLANCFPTAAPSVFCCFDQPDLRAAITLIVTLPAGWTCISNGEALHQPGRGRGRRVAVRDGGVDEAVRVHPLRRAVRRCCRQGDATSAGATQLTVHCRPTLASSPGLARITGLVAAALRHYEQLLGVACPYDKLDIVFVPELGPLAMQLPAVMYVSEAMLQRAADPDDHHVAVVLAHEAAHLWFGCLVEGRWWDDLWLAEALATYLSVDAVGEALGDRHCLGRVRHEQQGRGVSGRRPAEHPAGLVAGRLGRRRADPTSGHHVLQGRQRAPAARRR